MIGSHATGGTEKRRRRPSGPHSREESHERFVKMIGSHATGGTEKRRRPPSGPHSREESHERFVKFRCVGCTDAWASGRVDGSMDR
eukprot:158006-Chlamydomonas_euryale.AAC.2